MLGGHFDSHAVGSVTEIRIECKSKQKTKKEHIKG